jgi:acetyl esterase/lipase
MTVPDIKAKGCIALYSPMDLEFAHTWSREDDIIGALKLLRNYLGGDPEDASENYRTASAINFVTPKSVPTLLLHGRRDALVWVEQSIRYKAKYEKVGIADRCKFVELPWAVHAFDYVPNSPGWQVSLYEVKEFLKQF